MQLLDGLEWQPRLVSHLGCVKGCLDYLGIDVSWPWLYGGTGHAFIINMHRTVDVSGPTAWNAQMLFDLAPNLGYRVDGFSIEKEQAGAAFGQKQLEAWAFVRGSIDHGLPCYGWELHPYIPDYFVITGYDLEGYYYSGCVSSGPLPWRKLGDMDVKVLQVYRVEQGEPAADDKAVKEALEMALRHAENPEEWIAAEYRSGPAGFDIWAEALETGQAIRDGQWYVTTVWHECREMAVAFLEEARERLPGRCDALFDEGVDHYALVRDRLAALLELHPEREKPDWHSTFASAKGADLVREAGAAEREGLACLRQIVSAL